MATGIMFFVIVSVRLFIPSRMSSFGMVLTLQTSVGAEFSAAPQNRSEGARPSVRYP